MTGGELLKCYARPKTAWTALGGSIEQPETRAAVFPIPLTDQQKAVQEAIAVVSGR